MLWKESRSVLRECGEERANSHWRRGLLNQEGSICAGPQGAGRTRTANGQGRHSVDRRIPCCSGTATWKRLFDWSTKLALKKCRSTISYPKSWGWLGFWVSFFIIYLTRPESPLGKHTLIKHIVGSWVSSRLWKCEGTYVLDFLECGEWYLLFGKREEWHCVLFINCNEIFFFVLNRFYYRKSSLSSVSRKAHKHISTFS